MFKSFDKNSHIPERIGNAIYNMIISDNVLIKQTKISISYICMQHYTLAHYLMCI